MWKEKNYKWTLDTLHFHICKALKDNLIQSRVEMEGYSVAYFPFESIASLPLKR